MKTGRTIEDFSAELARQNEAKKDFVAATSKLEMIIPEVVSDDMIPTPMFHVSGHEYFGINNTAHEHLSTHTGIHKKYYDRMLSEAPDLLAANVNHWLHKSEDARMVRTLDNRVRAVLSPRYRILDNFDLFAVIGSEWMNYQGELQLMSSEVTDHRLYMKFVMPSLQREIKGSKVGDIVSGGVIVSNSEIGAGRIKIEPFLYTLRCTNGMIAAKEGLRKNHVGRAIDDFDEAVRYFADETRQAEDKAFYLKVRDVFKGTLSGNIFNEQVNLLEAATEEEVTGNIEGAVQVLANKSMFTEDERANVLNHFIHLGDFSKYGLANAVTRTAEDLTSYDRATEFERIGGEVIVMPQNEWKQIATASAPEEKKRRRRSRGAEATA